MALVRICPKSTSSLSTTEVRVGLKIAEASKAGQGIRSFYVAWGYGLVLGYREQKKVFPSTLSTIPDANLHNPSTIV